MQKVRLLLVLRMLIELITALEAFKTATSGKLPKYLELTAETNNSKDELKEANGETSVEYDYAFTE